MSKKKSRTDTRAGDRHKPAWQVRIHPLLAAQLEILAKRTLATAPAEANRLIREGLERLGLWPPADAGE